MALIDALLKPARSLVVTFSADGTVLVEKFVRNPDGTYPAKGQKLGSTQVKVDSPQDTIHFEFKADGDANEKSSALFVEMVGDWPDATWDCDLVNILGGDEQFPFGNGPLGIPSTQRPSRPRVRVKKGVFASVDLEADDGSIHAASEVTIFGVRKTSIYQIGTTPTKIFALWLPEGLAGQVKFYPWAGEPSGEKVFRSDGVAANAAGGKTTAKK